MSGPGDRDKLSPREQAILAALEEDLRSSDPGVARRPPQVDAVDRGTRWAAEYAALSAAVLLILIITALLPPAGRAVLGLICMLVVLPYILLRADRPNTPA